MSVQIAQPSNRNIFPGLGGSAGRRFMRGGNLTVGRRGFIGGLTVALLGAQGRAFAQKMPRIGVLVSASPPHPFADAFRRGLQPLGYVEGENIAIEWRYTGGRSDHAGALAAELVKRDV